MFRRYEPLLKTAVDAFPNETSFSVPDGISPTTFVARFRDARLSYLKFNWASNIDRDKLLSITGKYTISLDNSSGKVWFRQKQSRGRPSELISESRTHTSNVPAVQRWDSHTPDELQAACLLITSRKLSGPIVIAGEVPSDLILTLSTSFDVSLVYDSTKNETILM